ncbi:hypothetical protein [Faecalibacter bovis]|uniref:Uncharacterized protein n=1 Tax=Faecalibacter bovis TaxID=2898187 RepID=A0ABX7XCI0_9FLAO|nr:hypothetical protein [Faecalibacter bovis]MBS7332262.1 hypothetical protein [Weeksellaceae bacterium]QTV05600.1 hypothetical protein J9309_12640 [Faecalibacter bovis]
MNENPLDSLNEIKSMMQKSSKFTSISGWSGVWVGFIGLLSAAIAYFIILESKMQLYSLQPDDKRDLYLVLLALITLILALVGGFYFMIKKSSKDNITFINPTTKRILKRFLFVLIIGGFLCLALYKHLSFVYIAPTTLLFYGMALLNVERDTVTEIRYLAYTEIFLGLLAFIFIANGLAFWSVGFGLVHIIFGAWMVRKYDYKS